MSHKITMDCQYQTRDGRKVRLYTIDTDLYRPVIGKIEGENIVWSWHANGRFQFNTEDSLDLIPVPKKRVSWANFYRRGESGLSVTVHDTIEEAHVFNRTDPDFIETRKIEIEESN